MPSVKSAGLYWRTLRHLRPVQLYGRLIFNLIRPRLDTSPAPSLRPRSGQWVRPPRRSRSMTGPGQFRFLNLDGDLEALGWLGDEREKLWRYNQHYFDDLNARDAGDRADWHASLIDDWIFRNPPGRGEGWEPYPASLRMVNWIKWALAGNTLPEAAPHSLAVQARWLMQRLELHLLGNHLFVNAKALVFAGLFFDGAEAQTWLNKGMSLLRREVAEQILPDGGQFELSPMYHALALEDVLDLTNIARCFAQALTAPQAAQPGQWSARVPAMRRWLAALTHPDGEIAFFNDAAIGIAPAPEELHAYAERLGLKADVASPSLLHLPTSGYVRLAAGPAVLIADVAPIGPDYLPAHAHADSLSFELSLGPRRVVVNSGTSVYGIGPERSRQRSTPAHSTVVLDEQNSSEVWGGFRVGRRARIIEIDAGEAGPALYVQAAHDGYRHLPGRPVHSRRWSLSPSTLQVADTVRGAGAHAVEIVFHFGPDLSLTQRTQGRYSVSDTQTGVELATVAFEDTVEVRMAASSWHPEFGLSTPTVCLTAHRTGGLPYTHTTVFTWSPV